MKHPKLLFMFVYTHFIHTSRLQCLITYIIFSYLVQVVQSFKIKLCTQFPNIKIT